MGILQKFTNCHFLRKEMAGKMEVDGPGGGVMASTSCPGSVSVSLHPLVIMNISEHWTRVRAQEGKPTQGTCISSQCNVTVNLLKQGNIYVPG